MCFSRRACWYDFFLPVCVVLQVDELKLSESAGAAARKELAELKQVWEHDCASCGLSLTTVGACG